ncbi:M56 family metallopeptidase [Dysosmobacter sp.]|uniref:M56 family metallopeptidase n=1 Tax=Dysosmobacter sp. TaxID=2591382 RepID=UPI002A885C65|nr:M56 family metallopeptidase [Dysosmobacter sp.]MDY3282344.1 M56 family metallopeptidase [Dysosmobacter sp.]
MAHLTTVFQALVTMALAALPVMAAVLAVRFALGKAPRRFAYVLWAVVAFRLLCPVSVESPVGLARPAEAERRVTETADRYLAPTRTLFESAEGYERAVEHGREPIGGGAENYVVTAPDGVSEPATLGSKVLPALSLVWLAGMAGIAAVSAGAYLHLRRRLATAVRLEGNVYQSEAAETPFVLGWLRPRIYIPFRLTEEERQYVLLHEETHLRRGDHWWKLLGFALVTVYWWDPAVWLCWVLFCRDMEMSCDEAVLRRLGGSIRAAYSESLLRFAAPGGFPALAFGEHGGVARIKNVLKWRPERRWTALPAGAAVVLALAVCGTNAVTGSSVTLGREGTALTARCRLEEPIRAWALVQDVYEVGTLRSSTVQVWGNTDTGWADRSFTGALELRLIPDGDGFAGTASCRWSVGGVDTEWTVALPEDHYTGSEWVTGDSNKQEKYALTGEDSVVLASFLFSARSDGGITFYQADLPLTEAGDAVVQYRLVTSTDPSEDFADQEKPVEPSPAQPMEQAVWFAPEDIRDIETAELLLRDGQRARLYRASDAGWVEERFGGAREITAPGCPFGSVLYLQRGDGVLGQVQPAQDGCPVFRSGETYYRMETDGDFGPAFYGLFGVDMEELTHESRPGMTVTAANGDSTGALWLDDGTADDEGIPALSVKENTRLTLEVSGGGDTLVIGEAYDTGDGGPPERRSHTLTRNGDGTFTLPVIRQDLAEAGQAVYTVPWEGGRFLFRVVFSGVKEEPFRDILGYDGFVRTETDGVGWSMRTYYAVEGERTFPIAEAWGYHAPEEYAVDLDGDGRKELVANVEYGADGHEDTLVYRRRGDAVEQGWLDLEGKLPDFDNWGINAHSIRYDPAEGVFRVRYALKNSGQYGTMEFRGLGDFLFAPYAP